MAISNGLFLAILAMDAYNRGYNAGLNVSGNQIGNASIGLAKGDQEGIVLLPDLDKHPAERLGVAV